MSMHSKIPQAISSAALALILVGCNATGAMKPPDAFPVGSAGSKGADFVPNSKAGLKVAAEGDAKKMSQVVATRAAAGAFGVPRSDPFALTSLEKSFERDQSTERFFSSVGGFSVDVTPKPDTDVVPVAPEPQPYRRLSGIVVGDSILAILEEDGKQPIIVTPGMMIPNSPWRVVSIDQDKAILRRSGSARPSQIVVRLETPRFGTANSGQGGFGGGQQGGYPGGGPAGPPGGPPGGYRGGPPGGGPGGD